MDNNGKVAYVVVCRSLYLGVADFSDLWGLIPSNKKGF